MSPPSSNLRSVRRFNPVPRIRFLAVLAVLAASVLLGRLWFLQVKDGPLWRERAERQYMISAELPPERGEIFFSGRDGIYPAAVNKDYLLLYIVPREIKEEQREEVVRFLRDLLGEKFDEEKLRAKLARSDDPYEIVARKLDVSLEEKVREQAPPGVYTQREKYRFYPAGALAAETIGFLTPTGEKGRYRGVYGLERSFEKFLAGKDGSLKQARDSAGRWISLLDREFRPAEDGADLILTIDRAVQTAAREILKETVKRHRADRGSILVMRPDGDILAMASEPNFDPNNYGRVEDQSLFVNPIVSHTYELGSVVKPITMAAGLDSGKISPETTFVDVGFVKEAGYTIRNSQDKVYGRQTMTEVLENSINTGVIFVEKTIGHRLFAEYFRRFGFGRKTQIALPAENKGNIRNLEPPIRPIQFYTASFGQGVTMTLLQLTRAYAAIANDGMLTEPRLVKEIIHPDGRREELKPRELYRVIKPQTARQLRLMLESVVVNGHGRRTAVPGYRVGGKTGTAQVARSDAKGYDDAVTIGSFIGMAPIEKPEFMVAVQINNPKDVVWAESTAGPAFRKMMKFLLEYYDIPPEKEESVSSEKKEVDD